MRWVKTENGEIGQNLKSKHRVKKYCGNKGKNDQSKTTAGTMVDCSVALDLIQKIKLSISFGDRAYDINPIINYAEKLGIKTVIRQNPIGILNKSLILIYIICDILSKIHF